MTTETAFDPVAYINEPRWRSSRMGLERIRELMDRLGNPQDDMRIVHVAGTNGKGSTCAFTEAILRNAGFKTGLFTSPYIIEFSDRIRIDGKNVSPEELTAATLEVRAQAEAMADHPTEFELMTAVALVCFARADVMVAVLEVGLGGRLDSTNVVAAPDVCAIAPISYDHTALLGSTLAEIAGEKAGIIKHGASVVSAPQDPGALAVIQAKCAEEGCELTVVDPSALSGTPDDFSYGDVRHLRTRLRGSYQTENAALAIEIAQALRRRHFTISQMAIENGIAQATWPGRFEVVGHAPEFVVDGGHNPQGARALAASLDLNYPGRDAVLLVGVLADKDYRPMLDTVLPYAKAVVCIEPPNPRALPVAELAQAVREAVAAAPHVDQRAANVLEAATIERGVNAARMLAGPDGLVVAFGSLYSIGDIMRALAN